MRIVSWNIQTGARWRAVVRTIASLRPDLVALQEVDVFAGRSGRVDVLKEVCRALDYDGRFAEALVWPPAADGTVRRFGNAIMSRFPIVSHAVHGLLNVTRDRDDPAAEDRVALVVAVRDGNGQLWQLATAHLAHGSCAVARANRSAQAASLAAALQAHQSGSRPLLLAGDFNGEPEEQELAPIAELFGPLQYPREPTYPVSEAEKPSVCIDHIRCINAHVLSCTAQAVPEASDHCLLAAELKAP